jgi:hypothetical protein
MPLGETAAGLSTCIRRQPLRSQATYVEEVVAGHPRLAGDAGGDDNDAGPRQGLAEALVGLGRPRPRRRQRPGHLGDGGDLLARYTVRNASESDATREREKKQWV